MKFRKASFLEQRHRTTKEQHLRGSSGFCGVFFFNSSFAVTFLFPLHSLPFVAHRSYKGPAVDIGWS